MNAQNSMYNNFFFCIGTNLYYIGKFSCFSKMYIKIIRYSFKFLTPYTYTCSFNGRKNSENIESLKLYAPETRTLLKYNIMVGIMQDACILK